MSLSSSFQSFIEKTLDKGGSSYIHAKINTLFKKNHDLTLNYKQETPWALLILKNYPEKTKEVALNLMQHQKWSNLARHREEIWGLVFKGLIQNQDWKTLKEVFTHFKDTHYEFTGQVILRKNWETMSQTLPLYSLLQCCELSKIIYEEEAAQTLWIETQMKYFFPSVLHYQDKDIDQTKALAQGFKDYWTSLRHWPYASKSVIEAWRASSINPPSLTPSQKILCSGLVAAMLDEDQPQYGGLRIDLLRKNWTGDMALIDALDQNNWVVMHTYAPIDPILSQCLPEFLMKEHLSNTLPITSSTLKVKRI